MRGTVPALASNAHARWVSHSVLAALVLVLGAFPWVAPALGLDYYVDFVRRMLTLSLAALSLNFLIGNLSEYRMTSKHRHKYCSR